MSNPLWLRNPVLLWEKRLCVIQKASQMLEVLARFSLEDRMLELVQRIVVLPDRRHLDFDAVARSLPDLR